MGMLHVGLAAQERGLNQTVIAELASHVTIRVRGQLEVDIHEGEQVKVLKGRL
jgi:hypothetical protein